MDFFCSRRFSPNVINESDSARAVLLSVSAGLGISVLPSLQAREFMQDSLDVIPLGTEITYAVAWKKSLLNPSAVLFLDIIKQHLNECL